jgi:signal transduction histidine kinase
MDKEKSHILYVDDEEFNLTAFRATFRQHYNVHVATNAAQGTQLLSEFPVEVIITDQRMPGVTGVEFLTQIQHDYPHPIRMVLTGFADIDAIIGAINEGQVYRYISKPWDEAELKMIIDSAIDTFRLKAENERLLAHLARYNEELEETVRMRTEQLKLKTDDLERINKSVIEQNKQITNLNREKAELLSLAGKDLQRPLKEILDTAEHGITKSFKMSAEDVTGHFSTVQKAGQRISAVLDNLLLLNKIEKSGIQLYVTNVDPGMIVQTSVMEHAPHAESKGIKLNFDRGDSFGMVHTDPTAVQYITSHLVSNAVKFSPLGSVVHVAMEALNNGVAITISDSGPGFTDEDKKTLFTKFETHSAKPTAGELTTGLGLSIVKNYVDAIGGTITLGVSSLGGAEFKVVVPSVK